MKKIRKVEDDIYHVVSEPGDATRYNYVAVRDGALWHFTAREGTISYPRTVDSYRTYEHYDALALAEDREQTVLSSLLQIAEEQDTNPFTLAECMRTILALDTLVDYSGFFLLRGQEQQS